MVACLTQTVKLTATVTTQSYRDGEASKGSQYCNTKKTAYKVWKYFGDNMDGVKVYCLTCSEERKITTCLKICDGSTKPLR